jgi:hypothetical protein
VSFEIEFYEDPQGGAPVLSWLDGLSPAKREAARHALAKVLARSGAAVCQGEWGKPLDGGLYEFRIRHDGNEILRQADPQLLARIGPLPHEPTLLRIFFCVEQGRIILLLGAYDKGRDSSPRRQQKEIKKARQRLEQHRRSAGRAAAAPPPSRSRSRWRAWWIGQIRNLDRAKRSR